jgi:hypothetical protein
MKLTYLALVITACGTALAGTFTYNQTITLDPNAINSGGGNQFYSQQFFFTTPILLQAGDILTGTITFNNGPILIKDPAGNFAAAVEIFFSPVSGSFSTSAISSTQLLGVTGVFGNSNPVSVSASGGPFLAGMVPNGGAYNFSFTGFTYTLNVGGVEDNSSNPVAAQFRLSQFNVQGQSLAFGSTATPEPAPMALCGFGCIVIGWMGRRSRIKRARALEVQ